MSKPNPNEITIAGGEYYDRLTKLTYPNVPVDVSVNRSCDCISLSLIPYEGEAFIWLTYAQFDAIVKFVKSRRPKKRRSQ